jgi:predicted site-specific integrase-resolvase
MSSRGFPRKPAEHDHLLTLREAQELYGISKWVLYSQAAAGKIRAVRRGNEGRVYYLESEVRALLNSPWLPLAV